MTNRLGESNVAYRLAFIHMDISVNDIHNEKKRFKGL